MSNGELIINAETLPSRSYIELSTRGEVDMQVSTARRYPRSVKTFKERSLSLATLDEETAAGCFYSLPRGGKPIEGPSARLAEIVAGSWGNLRSQACIVDINDKFVTARGFCWDLENNTAVSVDVQRRITDKQGRRYNDDMIGVTSMAACSIALRNAIFKVVPMAMVKPIYEAARKVAIGDAQTLVSRREKMIAQFGKMGVTPDRIVSRIERASVEDISLDDLGTLIGLWTAIKDGDTTVDESFPLPEQTKKEQNGSKSEELAAKFKKDKPQQESEKTSEPYIVSHFDECLAILDDAAMKDAKTFEYAGTKDGILSYKIAGQVYYIGDKATGNNSVDTLEHDSVEQVKNIIAAANKKRG